MIRDIEKDDVKICSEIIRLNWGESEATRFERQIRSAFINTENQPHYYVCEVDKRVVGFAGMMPSCIMYGIWDFIWINIHPEFQKQFIGSQLTWFRIHEAQRLGASAIHLMTQNELFFNKFGFKRVHAYHGSRWVLMVKQLKVVQL